MESILAICLMLLVTVSTVLSMQIDKTFLQSRKRHVQHITLNKQNGEVIVGAENAVYRLSPQLQILQKLQTGPKKDNINCPVPDSPCNFTKTELRTFVKGLAIDYRDQSLIVCLTLYRGSCMIVGLNNITNIKKEIYKSVVSITRDNLLFVGKGLGGQDVLYVGVPFDNVVNSKDYQDQLIHLSSRNLADLELIYSDENGTTKISLLPDKRKEEKYLVQFLYGFSHGNFTYFITTRNGDHDTWIVRLCEEDRYFHSYIEIPLSCIGGTDNVYKEAQAAYYEEESRYLYVAFKNSRSAGALCSFNMNETERLFNVAVQYCYKGESGFLGPAHVHPRKACPKATTEAKLCGDPVYRAIEGSNPIFQKPLIEFDTQYPTSVITQHKTDMDVLYIGTNKAQLKKIIKLGIQQIYEVDDLQIALANHARRIQGGMMFSPDKGALYLTTSNSKVVKVDIRHCEEKTSCTECTSTSDPVCGWCVMTNKCTESESCSQSAISPHWLPAKKGVCAEMGEVKPDILSYEKIRLSPSNQEIRFRLQKVMLARTSNPDLHCSFSYMTTKAKTMATVENEVIMCPLPSQQSLDLKPEDSQKLEVEFHVAGHPIVKRDISVFDCAFHKDCLTCTMTKVNCSWHYSTHVCKATVSPQAPLSGVVSAPTECPQAVVSAQGKQDVVVHSGKSKQIAVRLMNMQFGQTDKMMCKFEYLGEVQIVNGTVTSPNLVCDPVKFEFEKPRPFVSASFSVLWGDNRYPIDIPSPISVQIYKCDLMVTSCGRCLTLGQEYECGWCNGTCELQANCPSEWLDPSATCPDPQIFRFSPDIGPIQGQTNITVRGINLGKAYTDIQNGVKVAGINCHIHPDHFEPSIQFKCLTEPTSDVKNGTVIVTVDGLYTANSSTVFSFVNPDVLGLAPRRGPKSGGTAITIYGNYMNAGTSRSVDLDGSPCQVIRVNKSDLVCLTSQHITPRNEVEVVVSFGGYKRLLTQKFRYIDDPVITLVTDAFSIESGGTRITVKGERLGLIQNPEIFLEGGVSKNITCQHLLIPSQQHYLLCNAPSVILNGKNYSETNPMEVHYGLNLDGVTTYHNLSRQKTFEPIKYYPDPDVRDLPEGEKTIKYVNKQKLVIKGKFRSINPMIKDVKIIVGKKTCNDVSASDTAITCEPPKKPDGIDNQGRAPVTLKIGFFRKDIGYISYYKDQPEEKRTNMTWGIILGVALPIILIIILLTICIIRRQKKTTPPKGGIPDMLKEEVLKDEEEDLGMNHVSVKADVNGQIPDQDCSSYISELLARIEDEACRQSINNFLILRSKLSIGELIGKGTYGNTYEAQYRTCKDADATEQEVPVSLKALQGCGTDNETIDAFLKQCITLKDLQHPNVLSIIGVSLSSVDEPFIVRPYLQRGDLKNYVKDSSKNITVMELLQMANQIAAAMEYLESLHIVHGNLAARNCLLSDDKVVMVSDYSITQMYSCKYYSTEDSRNKDVKKWWAPEAIDDLAFSSKTDCWSYGIVLWELLTRGVTPYPDVQASGLKEYLNGGHRLKKPRQCPENVYLLMLQCWTDVPKDRPSFQEIGVEISNFISEDDESSEHQPLKAKIEPGGSQEYLEVIG